jgi:hypothetical protein
VLFPVVVYGLDEADVLTIIRTKYVLFSFGRTLFNF